jgi:hypothetical protein
VQCEVVHGPVDPEGNFVSTTCEPLAEVDRQGSQLHVSGAFTPTASGPYGVTARIRPVHPALVDPVETALVTWA